MLNDLTELGCNLSIDTLSVSLNTKTDVPDVLLELFLSFERTGNGTGYFTGKNSSITLVLNPDGLFLIQKEQNKKRPKLHVISNPDVAALEHELLDDLLGSLNDYAEYFATPKENAQKTVTKHDVYYHRSLLRDKMALLQKYRKVKEKKHPIA